MRAWTWNRWGVAAFVAATTIGAHGLVACGDEFEPGDGSSGSAGTAATDGGGGSGASGGGGSGGGGGSSGSAGNAGAAGNGPCEPGTTEACYSGPSGTAGVGICKQGARICASDGSGFGACNGEVVPIAEDCTKSDDEDCDGVSCSELAWAKLTGDTGVQSLVGVATDANDNVFVAGKFEGTIDFGGQPLTTTAADGELFVAKLDPAGSVVWAKKFGSVAVWDIATDSGGNVILVGSYDNAGQFGTIGLPTPSQNFVAKVSSAGAALWAKSFPRKSSFYPTVAVGPSDGIVVAHGLDANGGNSTVISVRGFDASGAAGASQNFPSSATSAWAYPSDVAVDASGNVFVTASFQSKLLIGTQDLTSAGKDDVVSFKLSQAFTPLWALQFGGPGVDRSVQIAVDRSTGNVAVVGEFEATAEFAGASMTAVSSSDVYLVSATNGGTVTWRKQFGALTSPWPQAIAIDQAGNIAISGSAPSAVDFGGGEVSGAFLAKFTPSGDHVWSKGFGTQSLGWALATDSKDNLLLGGTATDPIDFGAGLLTPKGQGDAFVAKFAP